VCSLLPLPHCFFSSSLFVDVRLFLCIRVFISCNFSPLLAFRVSQFPPRSLVPFFHVSHFQRPPSIRGLLHKVVFCLAWSAIVLQSRIFLNGGGEKRPRLSGSVVTSAPVGATHLSSSLRLFVIMIPSASTCCPWCDGAAPWCNGYGVGRLMRSTLGRSADR